MYSATITQSGQVTLPKELRTFLGVKPGEKIIFNTDGNQVVIKRKLSMEEFFAEMEKGLSPKTRALIKANAGKTVSELVSEYASSSKGKREIRKHYGL